MSELEIESDDSDSEILNSLAEKFVEIQFCQRQIQKAAIIIRKSEELYGLSLEFEPRNGEFTSLSLDAQGIEVPPTPDDVEEQASEAVKRLAAQLVRLKKLRSAILALLNSISADLESKLSQLRGNRHWSLLVIRFCISPCDWWPRPRNLPLREDDLVAIDRFPMPTRVDFFLQHYASSDPGEEWQRLCNRFDSFLDDVSAVARVLGKTVLSKPDGPCHPYTWSLRGVSINDEMPTKAWRLVERLFESPETPFAFSELAEHVFNDHAVTGYTKYRNLRYEANKFFNRHGIPWKVSIEDEREVRLLNAPDSSVN
ncbi:hypothetical protein OAS39_01775 [Pirellulales bacterium]|nr:hypothetical protein [Pirellulales bacterium]